VTNILPSERIERSILLIRGHKVMLDADLAVLYGVSTKRLNEQVRRNRSRFPDDFMFQLSGKEVSIFEVAICDLKTGPRRSAVCPACLHGARDCHVIDGSQQ
jgi:ORF6N domain